MPVVSAPGWLSYGWTDLRPRGSMFESAEQKVKAGGVWDALDLVHFSGHREN